MRLEFVIWTLRGLTNQVFPIAVTFFLSKLGNTAAIAYLAPVFIACGIGNLLRSGAITASVDQESRLSSLRVEILYTVLATAPFLLITPAPSQDILLFNCIIILAGGISGAFAARVERAKGLHQVGLCDMASLIITVPTSLILTGLSPQSLAASLALREFLYLMFMIAIAKTIRRAHHPRTTLTVFARANLGQTIFWISGPWKDYLITSIAVALYPSNVYGTYYAVQLYWSLPSLFLGLILRPALKAYQNGLLNTRSIRINIFWMMFISISGLALVNLLIQITPPSPTFLIMAAILPAVTSPFVVPAMMNAVKANKSRDIVIQNILWAGVGCVTLLIMKSEGLTGLATTIVFTNFASIYIIFRRKC